MTEEPFGKNNIESFVEKLDAAFSDNQNPQKSEPKGKIRPEDILHTNSKEDVLWNL